VETARFDESSSISIIRDMSSRWFAWNLLPDIVPTTTPLPYMRSKDVPLDELAAATADAAATIDDDSLNNQEKHVFHQWQYNDAIFECSTRRGNATENESKSTIIWKTPFGYLSYLDKELMEAIRGENMFDDEWDKENSFPNYYSFKMFYKMNKLTKVYKNMTVKVGKKFGYVQV
jgi:hypothetical protein